VSGARITRSVAGPVHLLHTKNVSLCDVLNAAASPVPRQWLNVLREAKAGGEAKTTAMRDCENRMGGAACALHSVSNHSDCRRLIGRDCPFRDAHVVPKFEQGRRRIFLAKQQSFERFQETRRLVQQKEAEERTVYRMTMARFINSANRRRRWCRLHLCVTKYWRRVDGKTRIGEQEDTFMLHSPPSPPPPPPPSPSPPGFGISPLPGKAEQRLARAVGATDFANLTAIFTPSQEPLSSLARLQEQLGEPWAALRAEGELVDPQGS